MVGKLLGELALLQGDAEHAEGTIDALMERLDKAIELVSAQQMEAHKAGRLAEYQQRVAEESALNAAYQRLSQAKGRMIYGRAQMPSGTPEADTGGR